MHNLDVEFLEVGHVDEADLIVAQQLERVNKGGQAYHLLSGQNLLEESNGGVFFRREEELAYRNEEERRLTMQ